MPQPFGPVTRYVALMSGLRPGGRCQTKVGVTCCQRRACSLCVSDMMARHGQPGRPRMYKRKPFLYVSGRTFRSDRTDSARTYGLKSERLIP